MFTKTTTFQVRRATTLHNSCYSFLDEEGTLLYGMKTYRDALRTNLTIREMLRAMTLQKLASEFDILLTLPYSDIARMTVTWKFGIPRRTVVSTKW